ncbi:ABC transporter permease [Dictyobacter arantiisoli]|uniref:ABC transporter permease n=1 Tax=Dictyobacter arantiisoli TaxID=2014874 RepID=A0A5A5TIM7_9CHLR|nr:iron ABC transporter permease [Dictyobacter arantiisoli]GCF11461.1 ABC transporter permease [Dictyobacter arantiisoli]
MVPQQHRTINSTSLAERATTGGEVSTLAPLRSQSLLARWLQRGGKLLIVAVPLGLLLLFIVYPLAAIILQSIFPNAYAIQPDLVPNFTAFSEVIQNPEAFQSLLNSLWLGGMTALFASIIGTALAFLARRTDMPLRRALDMLVWIVFFTPSFLLGETWGLFFVRGGLLDQYIHVPDAFINWFYSPVGVIFILSLKSFPYVYLSVTAALRWLGSEFEDAARISGARRWHAWLTINIPLLFPAILAAALIAFAEALSDFGVAATIAQSSNVPLISYQIYTAMNTSPVDFALSATLSLLLFLAIGLAMVLQASLLRSRSFQTISGKNRPSRSVSLGLWRWPATIFTMLVFICALLVPVGICLLLSLMRASGQGFAASNWTLSNYQTVLAHGSDNLSSLYRTLWLALANASITAIVGIPLAFIIRRTTIPGRKLLNGVTLITIAVPGLILASGYIFAWNAPYLEYIGIGGPQGIQFYGTVWILLAAYIGGSLPYATRLNIGALEQVGPSMLETARVLGSSPLQLLTRIVAPLLRSNIISVWLLVFTGTMFELAASELLYPPGQPTLPVQIMTLFNNMQIGPGTALTMVSIIIVTVLLIILRFIPWLVRQMRAQRLRRNSGYVSTDQTIK